MTRLITGTVYLLTTRMKNSWRNGIESLAMIAYLRQMIQKSKSQYSTLMSTCSSDYR